MPTLNQLVERAVDGQPEARSWLVETFYGYVLRRVRRRYGQYLDPEDVTQQAFLSFLEPGASVLKRYLCVNPVARQSESTLRKFLWDQACGVASNQRRGRGRRRDFPVAGDVLESVVDPRISVEEETLNRDLLDRALRWMRENVGEKELTYFEMRYRLGYLPAEIAGMTGWTLNETYRRREKLDRVMRRCVA